MVQLGCIRHKCLSSCSRTHIYWNIKLFNWSHPLLLGMARNVELPSCLSADGGAAPWPAQLADHRPSWRWRGGRTWPSRCWRCGLDTASQRQACTLPHGHGNIGLHAAGSCCAQATGFQMLRCIPVQGLCDLSQLFATVSIPCAQVATSVPAVNLAVPCLRGDGEGSTLWARAPQPSQRATMLLAPAPPPLARSALPFRPRRLLKRRCTFAMVRRPAAAPHAPRGAVTSAPTSGAWRRWRSELSSLHSLRNPRLARRQTARRPDSLTRSHRQCWPQRWGRCSERRQRQSPLLRMCCWPSPAAAQSRPQRCLRCS